MSSDGKILRAFSNVTKSKDEFRYFEQVSVKVGVPTARGLKEEDYTRAYLCIGKIAIYFLKNDLSQQCSNTGCIDYNHLEKVVTDSTNADFFMFVLTNDRPVGHAQNLLVKCEHRSGLLNQMAICYLAAKMLKTGKISSFPRFKFEDMETPAEAMCVDPFDDFEKINYSEFCFFLRKGFKDLPNAVAKSNTGAWHARVASIFGKVGGGQEESSDGPYITLNLHVCEPVSLNELDRIGRSHIRWVAMEYKQSMVMKQRNHQTYVARDQLYLKKMNLSDDVAAWICWEMLFRSPEHITVIILMRRQFVPPLMDTAQDFVFVMKCPDSLVDHEKVSSDGRGIADGLLHECRLVVDSFGPSQQRVTLYPDIIKAKLDSLLFDEEALAWIRSRLRLKPDGEARLEAKAFVFLKGIIRILADENALQDPDLLENVTQRVNTLSDQRGRGNAGTDVNPTLVAHLDWMSAVEGLPLSEDRLVLHGEACGSDREVNASSDRTKLEMIKNAWQSRVARYLAWCVDGGLLGSRFTFKEIIMGNSQVTQEADKKLELILTFLLHVRSKDLRHQWEPKPLKHSLTAQDFLECTFNDKVMQVLLEMGYLRAKMFPNDSDRGMNQKYAMLLTNLLKSTASSMNLKASICRQIISAKKEDGMAERGDILCEGLLHLLSQASLLLKTYATAALVNLADAKEAVKNYLMVHDIAQMCIGQLKSRDDDLILYTLVLLIHHTKTVHHREALKQADLIVVLVETLLMNMYQLVDKVASRRRVIAELCGVLGQMCNDNETRKEVCDQYPSVLDCLLYIYDKSQPATNVQSKVLFAFKQLCANSQDNKDQIGPRVIKRLLDDIANAAHLKNKDWATNAIMLLQLLTISKSACKLMLDASWKPAYDTLSASPMGVLDATRDRIAQINERISTAAGEMQGKKGHGSHSQKRLEG